ncbi:hypothetical protein KW796_00925 [Candidatus Parcubacteria bacterium]|nr:hypothetical protein [Candidatus Parcubacteria bacterium]
MPSSRTITYEQTFVLAGRAIQQAVHDVAFVEIEAFVSVFATTLSLKALNGMNKRRDTLYYLLKKDAHDEDSRFPELEREQLLRQLEAGAGVSKNACEAGLRAIESTIADTLNASMPVYFTIENIARFSSEGVDRWRAVIHKKKAR